MHQRNELLKAIAEAEGNRAELSALFLALPQEVREHMVDLAKVLTECGASESVRLIGALAARMMGDIYCREAERRILEEMEGTEAE